MSDRNRWAEFSDLEVELLAAAIELLDPDSPESLDEAEALSFELGLEHNDRFRKGKAS